MIFTETKIKNAFVITLEKIEDFRGFFARAWCQNEFIKHGLNPNFVQCNIAFTKKKGTIRGMHYQAQPHTEAKLIRCIRGRVYDVMVDLRAESETYKQSFAIELSENEYKKIYIPEGCAHGYQSLTDNTELFYTVSQFYTPEAERGIRWDDPQFNINWPIGNPLLSEKDKNWKNYEG